MKLLIGTYNIAVDKGKDAASSIKWHRELDKRRRAKKKLSFSASAILKSLYRPFVFMFVYFERNINSQSFRLHEIFRTDANRTITFLGIASSNPLAVLACQDVFDTSLLKNGNGSTHRSAPCTCALTNFISVQSRSGFAACWNGLSDLCAGKRTGPIDQPRMSHRLRARGAALDKIAPDHRLCALRQRQMADFHCARCPRSFFAVDALSLALKEERVLYLAASRCRRSRDGSPYCQHLGWRV